MAEVAAGGEVKGELPRSPEQLFAACLVDPDADVAVEAAAFRPAFLHLSLVLQSGRDPVAYFESEKGSALSTREREILAARIAAVEGWLASYAPDSARYAVVTGELPPEVDRKSVV